MGIPVLDSSAAGVSLLELTKLSAMMAGAVSGALVSWLARRNVLLTLCSFFLGMMGGIICGTGMGHLIYVSQEGVESIVNVGCCSILDGLGGGAAGAIPASFVISILIGILSLRHLHPRPPRVLTALKGFIAGSVMGTLSAVIWVVV